MRRRKDILYSFIRMHNTTQQLRTNDIFLCEINERKKENLKKIYHTSVFIKKKGTKTNTRINKSQKKGKHCPVQKIEEKLKRLTLFMYDPMLLPLPIE